MADTNPDPQATGQAAAHTGESPPQTPAGRRRRHPLFIILSVVLGIVVYAIAFQQTRVNLEQITSETRQASLTRILRDLAHPELVTYDTTIEFVEIDIGIPCGPALATEPRLVATPNCGDPGDSLAVSGTGFKPREIVTIQFVPDSEFDITLRLASVVADNEGNISAEITFPDRVSERPQQLRAVTREPIGTWGNRVEVYRDTNENGVEDDPILEESGVRVVNVRGAPEIPAVALINPAGEVAQFVSAGDSFEAVRGLALGQIAIPLEEDTPDPTALRVVDLGTTGREVVITLEGPPGFDMTSWRAAIYDAATADMGPVSFISDTIRLSPRISDTAKITWEKILETVFLALVATTAGLLVAVPLSFVAARNIMKDISVTVTNLALTLLAIPLGGYVGILAARAARTLVAPIATSIGGLTMSLVAALAVALFLIRSGVTPVETEVPTRADRVKRAVLLIGAGAVGLVALLISSRLLREVGAVIVDNLGIVRFIGSFFGAIGEILEVALSVIGALATAGIFAQFAGKLGYAIRSRSPRPIVRSLNVVLSAAAGAVWALMVAQVIDWFYQIGSTRAIVTIPAIVGAVIGVLVAVRGMAKGEVKIGLSVYYAARTVFNTLRSIEPLVMAIVFVVWVGTGPFAGSLALALHTAAALAKLYSEQVESISAGPIEAVRATGANRLQTIVYSVVPQIVPPYISFTMYRWDINVRMSTILGFVGGGGIGSILQQNVNLLQYRAAAVQMLAIAVVVATMDYASSRLRERFV